MPRSETKMLEAERGVMSAGMNPWSFVTASYMTPVMKKAAKKPLETEDIPLLKPSDRATSLRKALEPFNAEVAVYLEKRKQWEAQKDSQQGENATQIPPPKPPGLLPYIFRSFGHYFYFGIFFHLIATAAGLYLPVILQALIQYLQNPSADSGNVSGGAITAPVPVKSGVGLAFLFFGVSIIKTAAEFTRIQLVRNFQYTGLSIIKLAVFEKFLKISNKATKEFSEGRILSMSNVDADQIGQGLMMASFTIVEPFTIGLTIYLLVRLLGVSIFPAAIVIGVALVLLIPVGGILSKSMKQYMTSEDGRLKVLREALVSMRWVKLSAEEDVREKNILEKRNTQLAAIRVTLVLISILIVLSICPPIVMPVASFLFFSQKNGGNIDPAIVFPALIYFGQLMMPMQSFPQSLSAIVTGLVALNRVKAFLHSDERPQKDLLVADDGDAHVVFEDATLRWDATPKDDKEEEKAAGKGKKSKGKKGKKGKKGEEPLEEDVADASEEVDDKKDGVPKVVVVDENQQEVEPVTDDKKEPTDSEPFFKNLNLRIPKGKLTAVVGTVGSGKSSLLAAILGDMTLVSGSCRRPARIGYCQQQPWLMSNTIRNNILFGLPEDPERLERAVRVSGLERDLEVMPRKLETQIGEKGMILSGGQRARVALARAIYADCEMYALDDPVAALDSEVGKFVFEEAIVKELSGKTRLLVTHQLRFLDAVDWVIVMDEGKVVETGTVAELTAIVDGKLRALLKDYQNGRDVDSIDDRASTSQMSDVTVEEPKAEKAAQDAKRSESPDSEAGSGASLIAEEDRERGGLKWSVFKTYWRVAGGIPMVMLVLSMATLVASTSVLKDLSLAWWSERKFGWNDSTYFNFYAAAGFLHVIALLALGISIGVAGYFAGKRLHNDALAALMRAPMSYFDSQPIGRLLNRMSKDIEGIDKNLWLVYVNFLVLFSLTISGLTLLIISTPWVLFLFALLGVLSVMMLKLYRSSVREIKRIVANEKSPLNAHISECLGGLTSLRAFEVEHDMSTELGRLLDRSNGPVFAQLTVTIWLNIRIEFFSTIVVLFVCLFGVLSNAFAASLMGLAISSASQLTEQLSTLIMMTAALESEMVAVERVTKYANGLPAEAERLLPSDPANAEWPSGGKIEIKNLEVKYRAESDPVIKDLTFTINPGEKVGIVGRTGSGKSTLLTALFRIVEPSSGTIYIDDLDTRQMGLWTLRERLQIIPQEPVLFTGTIRSNVDPRGRFDDARVWEALDLVGLKDFVSGKDEKLEAPVEEGGANLSVGQRQLLILARALCVRPRILVMDEASSAVDAGADALIQSTIKTHFKNSTVISIAHRLNTIADFDRIAVLDAGRLVEFDSPAALLRKSPEESHFARLVEATGPSNAAVIREMAEEHESKKSS
ncbi:hypothetical protein HDU96_007467 [Phlyctochytrium bullatum]|nr:hypothetical protein HDU96_007467 [Phlyctochytrium bullatum]